MGNPRSWVIRCVEHEAGRWKYVSRAPDSRLRPFELGAALRCPRRPPAFSPANSRIRSRRGRDPICPRHCDGGRLASALRSKSKGEPDMAGEPSHFEIGVPNVEQAQEFYGELLEWSYEKTANGAHIGTPGIPGGLHPGGASIQIFFSVPDLEQAAKRVVELGG